MPRAKSAAATGEKKATLRTKKTDVPTNGSNGHVVAVSNVEEKIRARAYELYERRGRLDGNHEADWFAAEAEVRSRTA